MISKEQEEEYYEQQYEFMQNEFPNADFTACIEMSNNAEIKLEFSDCKKFVMEYRDEFVLKCEYIRRQSIIRENLFKYCKKHALGKPGKPEYFVAVLMYLSGPVYKNYQELLKNWHYYGYQRDSETFCSCSKKILHKHLIKNCDNHEVAIVGTICIEKIRRHNGIEFNFNEKLIQEAKFNRKKRKKDECEYCGHKLQQSKYKGGNKYCPCVKYRKKLNTQPETIIKRSKKFFLKNCKNCKKIIELSPDRLFCTYCKSCYWLIK